MEVIPASLCTGVVRLPVLSGGPCVFTVARGNYQFTVTPTHRPVRSHFYYFNPDSRLYSSPVPREFSFVPPHAVSRSPLRSSSLVPPPVPVEGTVSLAGRFDVSAFIVSWSDLRPQFIDSESEGPASFALIFGRLVA